MPAPHADFPRPPTPVTPASITLLALDVDGVLTDGSILLDDHAVETKRFNVRDGFGLRLWSRLGFRAAIVTGRSGDALQHRARELGLTDVIQGSTNKSQSLDLLVERTGVPHHQVAFLGDDWPDLPILRRVGYPMAVADADDEVKSLAAYITARPGGRGAVRDAVMHLIGSKGLMEKALSFYA
jgi:3-deoxy-D-manno-octulosonate 8-phosphate phosphatase (KDO 8-P phosphatase)